MVPSINQLKLLTHSYTHIGVIKRHKWKSAIAFTAIGYSIYKLRQLYSKFKDGYGEFQKIIKLLDQQKNNLPEGEQPEDGTEEEFNFMTDILKQINDEASPILKTVVSSIQETEVTQKMFILNQLSGELKVEHWLEMTKNKEDKQAMIEAWNKLRTETIRELFYFIYISQVFLSCSYIVFSMTGKQLFEIHSGKSKEDGLTELAQKLEQKSKDLENPQVEENKQQSEEDISAKKKAERREKVTNIIHNHFMHLLFDVLTDFIKDLKNGILDPAVDQVMHNVVLKSAFTYEEFETQVLDQIYDKINDTLFAPAPEHKEGDNALDSDDDTDFESEDSLNDYDIINLSSWNEERVEELKESSIKKYRSLIVSKLVDFFNNASLEKYSKNIAEDLKHLDGEESNNQEPVNPENLPSNTQSHMVDDEEAENPDELLRETIETMKDYLETSYSQSIFIESVDFTYQSYLEKLSKDFKFSSNDNQLFMAKIIPIIYRNRSFFREKNKITQKLGEPEEKKSKKKKKPVEEEKVVELTEEEARIESLAKSTPNPISSEEPLVLEHQISNTRIAQSEPEKESMETKASNLTKSVNLFTKLILTEGIENSSNMPDFGDLLGLGGDEMGDFSLLQSIMT